MGKVRGQMDGIVGGAQDISQREAAADPANADTKLSLIVGENLRRLRRQRGFSLEQLSHLSGVSRAMLGQIETGKSAPTINLLDRVARALGVSIAGLISQSRTAAAVILPKDRATVHSSGEGRFRARAILPPSADDGFNVYDLTIEAGHRETVAASARHIKKVLLVTAGVIDVAIAGDTPARLSEGDGILFNGDAEHCFFNPGPEQARAFLSHGPADPTATRFKAS